MCVQSEHNLWEDATSRGDKILDKKLVEPGISTIPTLIYNNWSDFQSFLVWKFSEFHTEIRWLEYSASWTGIISKWLRTLRSSCKNSFRKKIVQMISSWSSSRRFDPVWALSHFRKSDHRLDRVAKWHFACHLSGVALQWWSVMLVV